VHFALKQWAEIYVDGRSVGRKQNAAKIKLEAGSHELAFRNDEFGLRETTVIVKEGGVHRVEVDFEQGKP
jgi:hypothetical protein